MIKRFIVACLLLSAALLTACGGTPAAAGSDDASAVSDEIELTLWTFPVGSWGNPTAVSNILTSFHREYPGIHIAVEYLNYDNGDSKILEAVTGSQPPDLVMEGPERLVANWGEKGWMLDLSDLWESDQAGEIYENIRDACQHQNGAYYVFPICTSAHCMAINYDMFQEAGALSYIDEETHTWTTENFIKAVQALNAYGQERVGILYCKNQSGDQGTRALVTNLYGGSFTDETHTFYTVDSEENRKALQLLYDLDGITFEPALTSNDAIDLFCKKETAMCFCWNSSLEIQQTINNPDLDFKVFPIAFPTDGGAPKLQVGIWGFGIFKSGNEERIEAAKTFIRYLTENDGPYTRAVLATSYWPVRDIGDIYENDNFMATYSSFMAYMGDYYQNIRGWTNARTAWCRLLKNIGSGADITEAIKDFPALARRAN